MASSENQRIVTTGKALCDANHRYTMTNIEAMKRAMNRLKPNAYKLWVYLGKNQDQYTFALSQVDVTDFCGMSRNTYLSAFKELEAEGYLVRDNDGSNHYNFYEIPVDKEDGPTITVNKSMMV